MAGQGVQPEEVRRGILANAHATKKLCHSMDRIVIHTLHGSELTMQIHDREQAPFRRTLDETLQRAPNVPPADDPNSKRPHDTEDMDKGAGKGNPAKGKGKGNAAAARPKAAAKVKAKAKCALRDVPAVKGVVNLKGKGKNTRNPWAKGKGNPEGNYKGIRNPWAKSSSRDVEG